MVLKGLFDEQHDEHHGKQLGEVLDHRLPRCPPQLRLLCQLQSRCPPVGSGPPLLLGGVLFPPQPRFGACSVARRPLRDLGPSASSRDLSYSLMVLLLRLT